MGCIDAITIFNLGLKNEWNREPLGGGYLYIPSLYYFKWFYIKYIYWHSTPNCLSFQMINPLKLYYFIPKTVYNKHRYLYLILIKYIRYDKHI